MKILKFVKSITVTLLYKIRFLNACRLTWINSLKGHVDISIGKDGVLTVKRYLISNGELYIRVSNNACIAVGENVFINHNCSLTAKEAITIGNNVVIANNVVIVDRDHMFDSDGVIDGYAIAPVRIEDDVWVGANSVILKGITIGEGSIIGAGSVVNKSVPATNYGEGYLLNA